MSDEFWCWFYIVCFFALFGTMVLGAFWFPRIKTPWFRLLWDFTLVRFIFAVVVFMASVGAWLSGLDHLRNIELAQYHQELLEKKQ